MKVLLIEPPFSDKQVHVRKFGLAEPLALEVLAGSLRQHDVRILDMRIDPDLEREMNAFQPDIVGAGCYTTGVYATKKIFGAVKKLSPDALTIVGGHHASLVPQDFFDPAIDAICIGDGEITLQQLVNAREKKADLRNVAGLALRGSDGALVFTPKRNLVNLNDMPLANRSLVAQNRQKYFRGSWRPLVSVASERGCPFRCHFCSMWKVNEGKYRLRTTEAVVDEIGALNEVYVDFVDDNTFHDVKRARRMAELLKERGIRKQYKAYARSDTITQHPELIEQWREVGLTLVLVGLESFRESDLAFYGKRTTMRVNEEAIRILHENDIELVSNLVVNPDYSKDDFDALAKYVQDRGLTHPVFTILTPLPGTDYYESVRNTLTTNDYELFDFFHCVLPTVLPADEFARQFHRLWKRTYSFKNFLTKLGQGKVALSLSQVTALREFLRDLKAIGDGARG